MIRVGLLVVLVFVLAGPVRSLLSRARWLESAPRVAIALWQSILLSVALCLVGAAVALFALSASPLTVRRERVTDFTAASATAHVTSSLSPNQIFAATAAVIIGCVVLGILGAKSVSLLRIRERQRLLLDLVGSDRPDLPAVVVDDPRPTAFSIPGIRPRVVVSTGALEMLSTDELDAVLAHEWAHVRARHDLVLLPFQTLAAALPRSRALARTCTSLTTLVEMSADRAATRHCDRASVASALTRLSGGEGAAATPAGCDRVSDRRIKRVMEPPRRARGRCLAAAASTLTVLALPSLVFFGSASLR